MPTIYLYASVGTHSGVLGFARAEDGTLLGEQFSSNEDTLYKDLAHLGHLADYAAHYPDGYTMEVVPPDQHRTHPGYLRALQLAHTEQS